MALPESSNEKVSLFEGNYQFARDFLNDAISRFKMDKDELTVESPDDFIRRGYGLPASCSKFFPDGVVASYTDRLDPPTYNVIAIMGNLVYRMTWQGKAEADK